MAYTRQGVKALQAKLAAEPEGLDHETSVAVVDQLLGCMDGLAASTSKLADAKTEKRRSNVARAINKPLSG